MSTFADGKSSPQILDYIQSAPKGTSKKLIEEIYHKHNGDHAKIHEAISGMWNRRESNSREQNSSTAANNSNGNSNASKDGEWESVQKRKKRERKPYDNSGTNGDSRRGGRGGRGRGRGAPPRGIMNPHHNTTQHKKPMDGRGSSVGGARRGGIHRTNPVVSPAVSTATGFDMSPAVAPVKPEVQRVQPVAKPAVSGSTSNPWSKGPPDFARMLRGEEEAKKVKEQHKLAEANATAVSVQTAEQPKDDVTPGQAFDNAAPSAERRNRGRVDKEVPKPVVDDKPKVPSWADRLTKPPQPPKPPTPVPVTVVPVASTPVEPKPKEEVIPKPVEVEKVVPAATESVPPVSKPKASVPQAPMSEPTPIAKPPPVATLQKPAPASSNIVSEKKQEGKAVKLPANFGVGGNSSFNVAFGATSFDTKPKKATPSQWGQGSRQKPMQIQKKPQSKPLDESKGKSISSKPNSKTMGKPGNKPMGKPQQAPKDLERSQKKFMSDLMTGNASNDVVEEKKKNVVLHGEGGGAVSAADLESKMLAAQKGSAKEEQMMKQQVPQVSLMTNKQHSGNTGGDRYNKSNSRNKNPRGMRNMEKPYNMARNVGPGLPTSQDAETQQGNTMGYNTMQYQQSSEGYNQPRQQESYASNYGYNADPFYNTPNQTQQHSLEAGAPPPGMSDGSHQVAGQRQHKDQQQPMGHHQPPPQPQHNQMHHHHQQQQQQAPPQQNNIPQQQQQQQLQQQSNQPGSFGGSQFGQQQYNAPPGMNPVPYQNNIPPYYPANNYYYGYPQYGSSHNAGQYHQSQFPAHNMYEGGVPSSFGGPYEQPNMYQGYDSMNQFSGSQPNIGSMTLNDTARQGASSSQGMNVARGAGPSNISGKKSGTGNVDPQQQGGPPGYSQQPQQPYGTYGNQHFQQPGQPGNYFIQQPPMQFGHQQQQFPPQQQQPQPPQQQQQQQPPQQQQLHRGSQSHQMTHQQQTSHGGWNSNNR